MFASFMKAYQITFGEGSQSRKTRVEGRNQSPFKKVFYIRALSFEAPSKANPLEVGKPGMPG
jgi:hypothetical protein